MAASKEMLSGCRRFIPELWASTLTFFMIDIKKLSCPEFFKSYQEDLKNRGFDTLLLHSLVRLNEDRRSVQKQLDDLRALQKKSGTKIAELKKQQQDASSLVSSMKEVSLKVKSLGVRLDEAEQQHTKLLSVLPNACAPDVPVGTHEDDNQILSHWGEPTVFEGFVPRDHFSLGEDLGILDFKRASKVSGARFVFLRGAGSRLERALIQFMMDYHTQHHGYEELIPPFIVNNRSLFGTGQFPKFYDDVFHVEKSASVEANRSGKAQTYHLVPTAEVPVTNFFADEVLPASRLPVKFVAYSPCFRSEAGSYGKDTQGILRQHQFNKVELVSFVLPEQAAAAHEELTGHAEKILQLLKLPYRKVSLCTQDIGFGAYKCYDLEVWLPGQKAYREISSCSNFGDFQARRAGIRFKPQAAKKPQFVHTLNGSGLAVGRSLLAILENYQQIDGSIKVPDVLLPYMRQDRITKP